MKPVPPFIEPDNHSDTYLQRLPYPIALTGHRLYAALRSSAEPLRTLFLLKDCFEACIKYAGVVLLAEYRQSSACTEERNEVLLRSLLKPSLGHWVEHVVRPLSLWLIAEASPPGAYVAGLFAEPGAKPGRSPSESTLLQRCKQFVQYRNDALGHGAVRPDATYRSDLDVWLPLVQEMLAGIVPLESWRLTLVADVDRGLSWTGLCPASAVEPGSFHRDQIGRFVLRGLGADRPAIDLYPFISYLPDPLQENRLHFYDSLHRYQATKKEAIVLEYDQGTRHPRNEPIAGLEQVFTTQLMSGAFNWHRGRMKVIEGRVANFGEILETHSEIVGRRFAIEAVKQFIKTNDRGLLVIEAEPGKGKTALMANLVEMVFDQSVPRPVHFFYRRTAGITDPDVCIRSIYHALLEVHGLTESEESKKQNSSEEMYHKLVDLLNREIGPRLLLHRPQLLFIDALDEADRDAFQRIPEGLPAGVYVIVSTRPVPGRRSLARRANVHWLNLDAPDFLAEDLRDGFEYAQRKLADTEVPAETIEAITQIGAGNFLVLKLLCGRIRTSLRLAEVRGFLRSLATASGPDQLGFLYQDFWQLLTDRCPPAELRLLCDVAGVVVMTHAPVTAELVCGVLDLRAGDWDFALRRLAEYLTVIEEEEDGVRDTFYRVYHESFADFLRAKVAVDRDYLRGRLADYCLTWSSLAEGYTRGYAVRFGPRHLVVADRVNDAAGLLIDLVFLEEKVTDGLVFELIADFVRVLDGLESTDPRRRLLELLAEALRRDAQFLAAHPESLFQCLWNSCWWYDSPESMYHYETAPGQTLPWEQPGPKISDLLERWRKEKAVRTPGFQWLRNLRPPHVHLGSPLRLVMTGHGFGLRYVKFSPDGTEIASAGNDGIRIWDAATGRQNMAIPNGSGRVDYSPDGTQIASVGSSGEVQLWDTRTGQQCSSWETGDRSIYALLYSPDGTSVATGGEDGTIRLWEPLTGRLIRKFTRLRSSVLTMAFSPDGRKLVSGGRSRTMRIWDTATGRHLLCLRGNTHEVSGVCFSPDGKSVASIGGSSINEDNPTVDGTVRVWDAQTGRLRGRWTAHEWGECVAFSPNGDLVLTGGHESNADGAVKLWDVRTGALRKCLFGHGEHVTSAIFSRDGRSIVSVAWDSRVRIWDISSERPLLRLKGHDDVVNDAQFSPDGSMIASCAGDRWIWLWDTRNGRPVQLDDGGTKTAVVAFSPDGQFLAGGGMEGKLVVFAIPSGRELFRIQAYDRWIGSIRFSADGQFLITSESRNKDDLRVWNLETRCRARTRETRAKLPAVFDMSEYSDWQLPQRVMQQETAAMSADGRVAIWFPAHLWKIVASPNQPLWAAPVVDQSYLFILSLETERLNPP